MARRQHEDDLVDDAERKAAARSRRKVMGQTLDAFRGANFGFLYPEENRILIDMINEFRGHA